MPAPLQHILILRAMAQADRCAQANAKIRRAARDEAIRAALADGLTERDVCDAVGLKRGALYRIKKG